MEERIEQHTCAAECHLLLFPWTRVIPSGLPERSLVAKLPSVATTFGWINSIWRKRWLSQASISSGCGSRFPGRTALEHVRDVDVIALQPDPREQLHEQLAGCADERHALLVLVEARRLTDEHEIRGRRARSEHDLRPRRARAAARAAGDLPPNSASVQLLNDRSHSPRHNSRRHRRSRRGSWAVGQRSQNRCYGPRTTRTVSPRSSSRTRDRRATRRPSGRAPRSGSRSSCRRIRRSASRSER